MDKSLENALIELLNESINNIDTSVSFLQAEIPEVISQLLTWYAVKGALLAVIGVLLLLTYAVVVRKAIDSKPDKGSNLFWHRYQTDEPAEFSTSGGYVLGVAGALTGLFSLDMILNIADTLQILVTPKVWLIEYASSLIK